MQQERPHSKCLQEQSLCQAMEYERNEVLHRDGSCWGTIIMGGEQLESVLHLGVDEIEMIEDLT